ncbi:MAG: phosphate ABC transporter permease PstA [Hyphomicrobiaceae bacterium]
MTDISTYAPMTMARKVDVSSSAAKARIRARYRSEALFKSYGIAALVVTGAFLVMLLTNILMNGLPSFWQHSLKLDVPLTASDIDPTGKGDLKEIAAGDFAAVARKALEAQFPGVDGRSELKTLSRLISVGAGDELRQTVLANPKLIGQTVQSRLLLEANSDLYLKGNGGGISARTARGIATPTGTTGTIKILTSANDFSDDFQKSKSLLAARAAVLSTEAARLERANTPDSLVKAKAARDEAAVFKARYAQPAQVEKLDDRMPSTLVEINGGLVKVEQILDTEIEGRVLIPLRSTDDAKAGDWKIVTYVTPESNRKTTDLEIAFLERLKAGGKVENHFNTLFFTAGDSRDPELAGVRGAIVGTVLTLLVTLGLCLPIGVMAAVYLEQFAPKNRLTGLIEVNINNLAAVPSIVFGLLGLAVFLNYFNLPRSAPLVGGLVLALLVLPTIIIASRAALKAVPPSIKEAALGVGASHQQAVFHHVLPLAMPGIMTGTIIGMAHALGETAPLLMIGMVAFIVDVPKGLVDAATVLPVQIYLWSDLPEPAFKAKTAGAIVVLLGVLFLMNGLAIWLRKKFERRW